MVMDPKPKPLPCTPSMIVGAHPIATHHSFPIWSVIFCFHCRGFAPLMLTSSVISYINNYMVMFSPETVQRKSFASVFLRNGATPNCRISFPQKKCNSKVSHQFSPETVQRQSFEGFLSRRIFALFLKALDANFGICAKHVDHRCSFIEHKPKHVEL